jgi:hypothetical protein
MKISLLIPVSVQEREKNVHRVLVEKTHGVRLRHRREDNIETDFKGVHWIHLVQDKH